MISVKSIFIVLLLILSVSRAQVRKRTRRSINVNTVHKWQIMNFGFPNDNEKNIAISQGNFVPENAIPVDVASYYNGKIRTFVTIPRFSLGIPYTLAYVTDDSESSMKPYPDYNWHRSHGSNCDYITSAFRVAITPCDQMWVIDSGIIAGVQHCPPQLLLFDLKTDSLVHRYRFNTTVFTPTASLLITPEVKVYDPPPVGRCLRTMVYVADVSFHGLIVYDYEQNAAWRAENRFMYPDPEYGVHTIEDETFNLMDGLFALSASNEDLYFYPLASRSQFVVPLNILADRTAWEHNIESHPNAFKELGERCSECAASAIDSRGNLFCVTFKPVSLISWNVKTSYKKKNLRVLSNDKDILQFVSGMKIVRDPQGKEELWMLSNRFQKISAGTLNFNEVNFRILQRSLDDLVDKNSINEDLHHKLIFD